MTTLKVEILGTGCKKCQQLEANAKEAIATRNLEADVAHITDTMEAFQFSQIPMIAFAAGVIGLSWLTSTNLVEEVRK